MSAFSGPTLFIQRKYNEELPVISVEGHNLNSLRYADDISLIAKNEKELQEVINKVLMENKKEEHL